MQFFFTGFLESLTGFLRGLAGFFTHFLIQKNHIVILLMAAFSIFLWSNAALADEENSFPDIPADHENAEAITYLKEQNIMSGDGRTGLFLPDRAVNRAEFSKMIIKAKGWNENSIPFAAVFPDVSATEWYANYIVLANQRGMIFGTGAGLAEPGRQVLMNEALAMSLRAFGFTIPKAATGEPWYASYLSVGHSNGVLLKIDTPYNTGLSRAQAAQMIFNIINAQLEFSEVTEVLVCLLDPQLRTQDIADVMNEVNAFFKENSYGKINLQMRYAKGSFRGSAPQYFGDEINAAVSVCDPFVDSSDVERLIIYPSATTELSFNVKSEFQTDEGNKLIHVQFIHAGDFVIGHIAHELGHSFGALHSHGLECGSQSVAEEGCRIASYASPYDVTGEPTFSAHFHGWNKKRMGWTEVREITESGAYVLPALEIASQEPQEPHVLRIPYPADESGLCIEYRKPIGFDDFASRGIRDRIAHLTHWPREGVILIYQCPDNGIISMIDTTPGSQTSESLADFADGFLRQDNVFANGVLGVTISFEALENDKAKISIQINPGGSIPNLPETLEL